MQLHVCGVIRLFGKSAKGPYDMGKLLTLSAIRPMKRENFERQGTGYECVEADCAPEVAASLETAKLPALFEVDGEPRASGDKVTFFITKVRAVVAPGVVPSAPARQAA